MRNATVKSDALCDGTTSVHRGRNVPGFFGLPPGRVLIGSGVLLLVIVLVGTAMLVIRTRDETLSRAESNIARINNVLAETLDRIFQSTDLTLAAIAEDAAKNPASDYWNGQDLRALLNSGVKQLNAMRRITVFDAEGRVVNSTEPGRLMAVFINDRPYFFQHRDRAGLGMTISEPLQSRSDAQWTFILSRRIEDRGGVFLGVVTAAVNLKYLSDLFAGTFPEEGARVSLLRKDLVMLFRYPYLAGAQGRSMAGTPAYEGILAGKVEGSGRAYGTCDPVERLTAARHLRKYPLIVNSAVPLATVLEEWRHFAGVVGTASLAVIALLAGLVTLLYRQMSRRAATSAALSAAWAALAEERGRLWSVVDASSDGFWEWQVASGIVDWSERCCALVGLPAAGGVLHIDQVFEMIHREDRDRFRSSLRRHVDSGEPFDVEARWLAVDGDIRWLASRGRVMRDSVGRPLRLIGANTDITARKMLNGRLRREGA
ncbi:MAG: PAS domain-containing protein [Rhodospirillaceae bacterium]